MERYIDNLKQKGATIQNSNSSVAEKREILDGRNPCVICCVTLGKELHAGHLFLLTIGEQMRSGLKATLPLTLINNNTGPRAAAALSTFTEQGNFSLDEACVFLDQSLARKEEVVEAYRNRNDKSPLLDKAMSALSSGRYDIFSKVASETLSLLQRSGFTTQIISESKLLTLGIEGARNSSPEWANTGFVPFSDSKRVVVIEKAGNLTATGASLASTIGIAKLTKSDFILNVDSMPDSADATFVFSFLSESSSGLQIPGAGIGFDGKIASGTKGEAFTISEILELFLKERPNGNLKNATLFFTLTQPVSLPKVDNLNLKESFYDFKDNESLLKALIKSSDEYGFFIQTVGSTLEELQKKISDFSSTENKQSILFLKFLSQKSNSLFTTSLKKVVDSAKKITPISSPDEINNFAREFGYGSKNPYISERIFARRSNFFFNTLINLLGDLQGIDSITPEDFSIVAQMVEFCLERLFV